MEKLQLFGNRQNASIQLFALRGLPEVFDPRKKPWINIEGADTEKIVDQVKACPSEALSYFQNDD